MIQFKLQCSNFLQIQNPNPKKSYTYQNWGNYEPKVKIG